MKIVSGAERVVGAEPDAVPHHALDRRWRLLLEKLAPGLPDELELLAFTLDGVVEAFEHRAMTMTGIMWNPEGELHQMHAGLRMMRRLFCET